MSYGIPTMMLLDMHFPPILQLINMWDKTSSSVPSCQLLHQYQFTAIFWLQQAVTNSKTLHWVLDTTDAKLISCLTDHENKFHSSSTDSVCTFFNCDLTSKYTFILKHIWNSHHYILSYATVLSGRSDQAFQGMHYICHQGSALLVVPSYYSETFTTVATSNFLMWECTFADSPTIQQIKHNQTFYTPSFLKAYLLKPPWFKDKVWT